MKLLFMIFSLLFAVTELYAQEIIAVKDSLIKENLTFTQIRSGNDLIRYGHSSGVEFRSLTPNTFSAQIDNEMIIVIKTVKQEKERFSIKEISNFLEDAECKEEGVKCGYIRQGENNIFLKRSFTKAPNKTGNYNYELIETYNFSDKTLNLMVMKTLPTKLTESELNELDYKFIQYLSIVPNYYKE